MNGEETVTILRDSPGGFDAYGDPVASTTARTDITGCLVAPTSSTEPSDRGREGVVIGWTVYAPTGTDARHTDRIEVRGVACLIEGEVGDWGTKGIVINATRGEG